MKYLMEKNQKTKLIFLDYDGVVNNLIFHTIDGEPDFYYRPLNEYSGLDRQVNDFQAVAWLNKICREFNCEIVVTSTWRSSPDYAKYLYRAGLNENIKVYGIIENMSYITCDNCGNKVSLFGKDNIELLAKRFNLDILAQLPLDPNLTSVIDKGQVEEYQCEEIDQLIQKFDELL